MPEPVRFQHYEVARREDGSLDELGRGAMGVTYRAFDTNLECYVALKVISSVYLESDIARQRFLREARAAAALRHPNVAVVFHLGEEGGDCFYAMEFVEGETLEARMKRSGTIPVAEALEITLQVARALGAAEKQGLVHRDLKPANLMITTEDDESINVKVIDFGLAKNAAGGGNDDAATVTLAGFLGTPQFASPEQLEEREIDIRSDIYSLGITLFYMLAGRAPFGGSIAQVMSQHLQREPPLEVLAGVPASVVALLRRMLAKDPSERQQTAADLRAEVEACLATVGPVLRPSAPTPVPAGDFETQSLETLVNPEVVAAPPSRRPVGIAVLAILILVLAGAFAIWRGLENPPTPVTSTSTPSPTPTPDPISQGLAEAGRLAASDPVAGLATLLELRKSNPARGELTERIDAAISALRKSPPPSEQARALIPLLGPLAAEGSVGAQVLLGEQVQESDPSRALSLFVSAAGQGNVDAMLLAGDMLGDGRGVSAPDLAGAAVWFRKAAEAGDPRGEYLFAECQLRGKGVKKDEAGAVELLTEASTKNEPRAMNLLGSLFQRGLPGVLLPDPGEAFRLFSSAKDEGLLDAQGNLGILYLNGEGVAKNDRVALDLFRDGAENGNPLCMYFFALCLEKGLGLSPDSAAAQGWYSRAAEAGSKPAQEWCRTNGVGWGSQSPKRP
ncbi:MAG: serine/threonine-protein kinase [Terrimicrobiaceae bacterium]